MTSKLTREENVQAVFDLKAGYTLGLADVELLKRVARMSLAAMDSEPVGKPFMYGIADPDGNAYIDELCVSEGLGLVEDTVNELNYDREEGDELNYSVVALYRHAQPAQTGVDDDVRNIIGLLETNEWAEHCTETVLGSRLEAEITRLIGCAQPAPVVQLVPEEPPEHLLPKGNSRDATYRRGAAIQAWKQCRAAMLQAGNSPVIGIDMASGTDRTAEVRYVAPPGYVMVPKEPTDEMIAAAMNCEDVLFNSDESFCVQFGNIYEAMLEAAPTGIQMNSNTWIPVSERMPEDEQEVITRNRMGHCFVSFFDQHSGLFFDRPDAPAACCIEHVLVTHWKPLPAAPQEAKP